MVNDRSTDSASDRNRSCSPFPASVNRLGISVIWRPRPGRMSYVAGSGRACLIPPLSVCWAGGECEGAAAGGVRRGAGAGEAARRRTWLAPRRLGVRARGAAGAHRADAFGARSGQGDAVRRRSRPLPSLVADSARWDAGPSGDPRPGRLSRCAGRARPGRRPSALRGGSDGLSTSAPAARLICQPLRRRPMARTGESDPSGAAIQDPLALDSNDLSTIGCHLRTSRMRAFR